MYVIVIDRSQDMFNDLENIDNEVVAILQVDNSILISKKEISTYNNSHDPEFFSQIVRHHSANRHAHQRPRWQRYYPPRIRHSHFSCIERLDWMIMNTEKNI